MRYFLILFLMINGFQAYGEEVTFGEDPVDILIRFESSMKDKTIPTFVRFPKPVYRVNGATKFIVVPASVKMGKPDHRELSISPLFRQGQQKVEFTLTDRTVVTLNLIISPNKDTPISYNLRPLRVFSKKGEKSLVKGKSVVGIDIMRIARSGRLDSSFKSRKLERNIKCKGNKVIARLMSVSKGNGHKVYKFIYRNTSRKSTYLIHPHAITVKSRDRTKHSYKSVIPEIIGPGENSEVTLVLDETASMKRSFLCEIGDQISLLKEVKSGDHESI